MFMIRQKQSQVGAPSGVANSIAETFTKMTWLAWWQVYFRPSEVFSYRKKMNLDVGSALSWPFAMKMILVSI